MLYSKSASCTRKQQLRSTTMGESVLPWLEVFLKLDLVVIITRDKWNLCLFRNMMEIGTGDRNIMLQITFILCNYAFVKGLYAEILLLNSVVALYIPSEEMFSTTELFSFFPPNSELAFPSGKNICLIKKLRVEKCQSWSMCLGYKPKIPG